MQQKALYFLIAVCAIAAGLALYMVQQYDFTTLDGAKHKHSDFHGRYVIVNYFAEWCAPCLKEVPELSKLNHIKPENVALFAVSYDNLTDEKLVEIKEKYDMRFSLINHIENPFPFERPQYLPATYIINPDGSLKGQLFGEQTAENLLSIVSGPVLTE
ncbi:TlpA family protein disulfide reductase [Glaciecola siphonariae]|uniref:TlpA family protein disulfide reductase n=1 Tax=Glaciecola siphonariae TaxID=521012 RepID=A0ABV9LSY9_9ALTE